MQEHFTRLFSRETYLQDECVVVETDTTQTALLRALTTTTSVI